MVRGVLTSQPTLTVVSEWVRKIWIDVNTEHVGGRGGEGGGCMCETRLSSESIFTCQKSRRKKDGIFFFCCLLCE